MTKQRGWNRPLPGAHALSAASKADARARSPSPTLCLLGLTSVLTIAAIAKPILWDEEIYLQFAQHIAWHPFDPYGAVIQIGGVTAAGPDVLAPPLLLYWFALAIKTLGSDSPLTAIFLFPFAAAYTFSFYSLARRFAPDFAMALTVIATISAWPLVTISYMLDFPATALGLAALTLFVTKSGQVSAIAAGLLAGLAIETKYNAAAAIAALFLWGFFARRLLDAVIAVAIAMLVFCAVELLIAAKYGQSHFAIHFFGSAPVSQNSTQAISRLRELLYGFIQNSGALSIGMLVLLPAVLGDGRALVGVTATLAVTAFSLSALGLDRALGYFIPGATPERMPMVLTMSGLLGLATLGYFARLLLRGSRQQNLLGDRDACFLLLWTAIEVLTYFAISPFPAGRRMGEIGAASLLFVGRAAILMGSANTTRRWMPVAIAINGICGLIMLGIVLVDGWNVKATARASAAVMRQNGPAESWQLSSLAFARYMEIDGIRRVRRDTMLQPGDLFATDEANPRFIRALRLAGLEPVVTVWAGVNLGVGLSTSIYRAANPWFARSDTRPSIAIFRATRSATVPSIHERSGTDHPGL